MKSWCARADVVGMLFGKKDGGAAMVVNKTAAEGAGRVVAHTGSSSGGCIPPRHPPSPQI